MEELIKALGKEEAALKRDEGLPCLIKRTGPISLALAKGIISTLAKMEKRLAALEKKRK